MGKRRRREWYVYRRPGSDSDVVVAHDFCGWNETTEDGGRIAPAPAHHRESRKRGLYGITRYPDISSFYYITTV